MSHSDVSRGLAGGMEREAIPRGTSSTTDGTEPRKFVLHAGTGRPWATDTSSDQHFKLASNSLRYLQGHAQSQFEEKFDWWTIFDSEGMTHMMGWSTGRTTPSLMETDRAHSAIR